MLKVVQGSDFVAHILLLSVVILSAIGNELLILLEVRSYQW